MIYRGAPLIHMLNQFRVAWLMGGYGAGKTLGCYALAWELIQTRRYRYIIGNSNSVWTDNPETVVLRDGTFVDAIVILDEAGLFLRLNRDADKFLLGLRKLNITILCPSVLPPSSRLKILQIQRTLNGFAFGIPAWFYQWRLSIGSQKEKDNFIIWQPSKVFGLYDTLDYPIDDLYISDWLSFWMQEARDQRPEWACWGKPKGLRRSSRFSEGESLPMDGTGRENEELAESVEELQDAISLYSFQGTNKRNKQRH